MDEVAKKTDDDVTTWHMILKVPMMLCFMFGFAIGLIIWPFFRGIMIAVKVCDDFWGFDANAHKTADREEQ